MDARKSTLLEELDEQYRQAQRQPFWDAGTARAVAILALLALPFVAVILYCMI